jgi:hypothetical protein
MNYGLAENEIAQLINSKFSELGLSEKFFAAAMPETNKEMKDFEAQLMKTRVAVEYVDSEFESPSDLGAVRQGETVRFRLIFDGERMRGEDGLFSMMDYVKKFLIGYRLTDCDPLTISAYGKTQFEPGVWMPHIEFECKTMNVQVVEYDLDGIIGGPFTGIPQTPEGLTGEFDGQQII